MNLADLISPPQPLPEGAVIVGELDGAVYAIDDTYVYRQSFQIWRTFVPLALWQNTHIARLLAAQARIVELEARQADACRYCAAAQAALGVTE